MKLLLLAVLVASMQSDTTALVEASKAAKAKKKPSTTKVITNADVKKSKGKVTELPASTSKAPAKAKPEPTLLEKQEAERTARLVNEGKRAELEKTIATLEGEVAALETSYYQANDLDYRDRVIAVKFGEAKTKLDAAKKELEGVLGSSGPR